MINLDDMKVGLKITEECWVSQVDICRQEQKDFPNRPQAALIGPQQLLNLKVVA